MKSKMILILAGFLLLASGHLSAQMPPPVVVVAPDTIPKPPPDTTVTTTKKCPGPCTGDCKFSIVVRTTEGDSCEANQIYVELKPESPTGPCRADFNRSPGGDISYILCGGEKCELDEDVFSDTTFWPPYYLPDNPAPAGKRNISKACYDALRLFVSLPPGDMDVRYEFNGVSTVMPDFGIEVLCICPGVDTIIDTLEIEIDSADVHVVEEIEAPTSLHTINKTGGTLYDGGTFKISQLFPVPARDELTVVIQAGSTEPLRMVMHDAMGRKVWQSAHILNEGENTFDLDVSQLKGGVYFLTLVASDDRPVVLKFTHL